MGLDAVEGDRHGGNPREEQARMLGLFLELVRVEDKKYPGVYHALVRAMELCAKELKTPEACLCALRRRSTATKALRSVSRRFSREHTSSRCWNGRCSSRHRREGDGTTTERRR